MDAINEAISHAGGVSKLAAKIGITQGSVSNWKARGTPPDPLHCVAIEKVTGGEVTVDQLRPAAKWVRVRDRRWPHPGGRPLLDLAPARTKKA